MEGNDIGVTVHKHIACHFEGLLMTPLAEPEVVEEKGFFSKFRKKDQGPKIVDDDSYVQREMRRWRANELPLKSVIHMTTKLGIGVEVYTYYDPAWHEIIEHWLARKGASVQVYHYDDITHLAEDLRYNRDVHTYFTPYEQDALILGFHRATVVRPDGTFGF